MKKILFLCGLLFSMIAFAKAQQSGSGQLPDLKEMAKKSAEAMAPKLKLNTDQQAKLLQILTENNEKIAKALNDTHGEQAAMGAAANKIMAETDVKINNLLTDAQKKDFLAWKQEQQAKRQVQH
jgi:protein CpxP